MRAFKVAIPIFIVAFAVLVIQKVNWRGDEVQQLAPSPTGRYIAKVSMLHFGHSVVWTKVFIWPGWAPIPSLMATEVLDAACISTVEWKGDNELHIKCPHPEGALLVQLHPWAVKIVLDKIN